MSKQKLRPVGNRTYSMLRRDLYRLFRTPLLYWFVGFAALLPGSFTVMTDPDFQNGFDAWGQVGSLFSSALFVMTGIFLAFFIGNDYKSGFIKNVCSITPKHRAFTFAKIITGAVAGVMMILSYILGAAVFGAAAGGEFTASGFGEMLAGAVGKSALMLMFCGMYACVDVLLRNHVWFAVCGSVAVGVLFLPAMMITLGSAYTMAGLSIAAGLICLAIFPRVAAFIMKQRDIL